MQPIPPPQAPVHSKTGTVAIKPNATSIAFAASWAVVGFIRGIVVTLLLGSLQAYKLVISPLLGSRCRFHPTCSCYAHQSVERFGPLRGSWLALGRLLRCGPWHPGGIDEVPAQPNAVNRNRA